MHRFVVRVGDWSRQAVIRRSYRPRIIASFVRVPVVISNTVEDRGIDKARLIHADRVECGQPVRTIEMVFIGGAFEDSAGSAKGVEVPRHADARGA